jgi:NADH:ubiquinone oxidoreductase subunit 5 (subunit L)/multisubunit Na+/H+ antiporter MnhA subunit
MSWPGTLDMTQIVERVAAAAPAWPALGALLISALELRGRRLSERAIVVISQAALWVAFFCVLVGSGAYLVRGAPLDVRLGHFYKAGDYGFELLFLFDGLSVPVALLAALLLLATSRFSVHYLHREPGFMRFFVLMLTFGAGILLLVLGGSYDLLLAGWEIVGLTSVLLVGFFHERAGPVRASLRVLVTYRICDIGLLLAAVWLHLSLHSTVFVELADRLRAPPADFPGLAIGLLLLFAAMGKSAQFPVGGWLPRAMEGPTASSAVFYGGMSVHAGIYLLIRSAPVLSQSPLVATALVAVGTVTAVMATLSGHVSADAKTGIAYATISQVALMVVECGLGLYRVATLHLLAHALLRYYQFLRAPSALQDALARRAALGGTTAAQSAPRWRQLPVDLRRFLYRLAVERFEVETALDRWGTRPVLALSRWLSEKEARLIAGLGAESEGAQPRAGGPPPPVRRDSKEA